MTIDAKRNLKDTLGLVATALNILLSLGVIFGGMKWINTVSSTLESTASAVARLDTRMAAAERALQELDKRHAIEDAFKVGTQIQKQ
jgi:hypothetical protein